MTKKICILTQSHLCRNPRVVKESVALSKAGYEVVILTTFTYPDMLEEDLNLLSDSGVVLKGVVNMLPTEASKWYRLQQRLVRRLAGEMIGKLHLENVHALGYDYCRNLKAAIREKADLYTCHQEVSTVIGCKLIKKGFRVAFDFEDWYSHDLLPEANRTRPVKILEKSEKFALNNGVFSYTTSQVMAEAMAAFAGSKVPFVLQNVFPIADRNYLDHQVKDRVDRNMPSVHWYSQTIGPGRGIEFLVQSLEDVSVPVELHLRGNIFQQFGKELERLFPHHKGHRLYLHPLVPHKELLSRIAEHDIGLATEEYQPDSRNLTITNKILQYLQAGIAVVATDTLGQQEVARAAPEAVALFKSHDRSGFSALLNDLIMNPVKLQRAKESSLAAAKEQFCWEKQEPILLHRISEVLKST